MSNQLNETMDHQSEQLSEKVASQLEESWKEMKQLTNELI